MVPVSTLRSSKSCKSISNPSKSHRARPGSSSTKKSISLDSFCQANQAGKTVTLCKLEPHLQSESGYKETFAEALSMRIGEQADKKIDRTLFNKWFPRLSKLMDAKLESRQKLFLQRGKQ